MNTNPIISKNSFNLYPKAIKTQNDIKSIIYYTFIAIFILNVCFGVYTFTLSNKVNALNKERLENIQKIEDAKPLLTIFNNIKGIKADVDKIVTYQKSITSVEMPIFDIIKNLEAKLPSNITLNSATIADDGKITLVGMSKNEFIVCDLVTTLKAMDKLSNVYLKSVVKKEDALNKTGVYVNIFTIECQVPGMVKPATGGKK